MSQSTTVLWLTPAEPARTFLRRKIQELAREENAPVFQPHLTLGRGEVAPLRALDFPAITLRVRALDSSAEFTKTLFVRFELAPELVALRHSLGMDGAGYDPHLSLLYRELPRARRAAIAAAISLPFSEVRFDRIEAVSCPVEVRSNAEVDSWRVVAAQPLA